MASLGTMVGEASYQQATTVMWPAKPVLLPMRKTSLMMDYFFFDLAVHLVEEIIIAF